MDTKLARAVARAELAEKGMRLLPGAEAVGLVMAEAEAVRQTYSLLSRTQQSQSRKVLDFPAHRSHRLLGSTVTRKGILAVAQLSISPRNQSMGMQSLPSGMCCRTIPG